MNRLSTDDRVRVLACLVEGNSIRATVRITDEVARITAERAKRNLPTNRAEARQILGGMRFGRPVPIESQ